MFKKPKELSTSFASRADAFNTMLAHRLEEGDDYLVAAEKADKFADIYAKNNGLPDQQEPRREGMDKIVYNIEKVVQIADSHPRIVELIVGAITFGAGLFVGNKSADNNSPAPSPAAGPQAQPQAPQEPLDFDNLPG